MSTFEAGVLALLLNRTRRGKCLMMYESFYLLPSLAPDFISLSLRMIMTDTLTSTNLRLIFKYGECPALPRTKNRWTRSSGMVRPTRAYAFDDTWNEIFHVVSSVSFHSLPFCIPSLHLNTQVERALVPSQIRRRAGYISGPPLGMQRRGPSPFMDSERRRGII